MKYIRQAAIILSISFAAELLEALIPIPVAASIYGLLLMLGGLLTGVIPLRCVEDTADFLVEIMPVMFIPPAVGIMNSFEELRAILVPMTVIVVVSTALIMAVTGGVAQRLLCGSERDGEKGSGLSAGEVAGFGKGVESFVKEAEGIVKEAEGIVKEGSKTPGHKGDLQ